MSAINIFKVPQVAHLTLGNVVARLHMVTSSQNYRSSFVLYRHANNVLDFLIRDIDRQPVEINGALKMYIWNLEDTKSLFETDLTMVEVPEGSIYRGHFRATISANDAAGIAAGKYRWSVSNLHDELETLLYVDTNYLHRGTITVVEGLLPLLPDPITIEGNDLTEINDNLFASSALAGAATVGNNAGTHSVSFYLDDFVGTIRVQGTLGVEIPTTDNEWTDIDEYPYDDATSGTIVKNITGNYTYIRFLTTPRNGFDKLVYRN